ncbi:MAG: DUF2892 domain-containing protein [Natronomonas sp.]
MKRNVGPIDARLRVVFGSVVGVLAVCAALGWLTLPFVSPLGAGIIAAVLIVEGVLSRCLLYSLLGIDRCPAE